MLERWNIRVRNIDCELLEEETENCSHINNNRRKCRRLYCPRRVT
jgi:hypothetical protein